MNLQSSTNKAFQEKKIGTKKQKKCWTGWKPNWAFALRLVRPSWWPNCANTREGRWHAGPSYYQHRGRGWWLAADFPTTAWPPGKPRAPACSTHQGDSNEVPWVARVSSRWLTTGNGGRRRSMVAHQRAQGTAVCAESFYTIRESWWSCQG
jgi:hypothetical protein